MQLAGPREESAEQVASTHGASVILAEVSQPAGAGLAAVARAPGGDGGRRVQKLGRGRWPAGSVDADRYCDASFIQLWRPLPGTTKTRHLTLCRSIQLLANWPVATPPRIWRSSSCATNSVCCATRRLDTGSSPPTDAARRHQPRIAPIPLVVFLCQAGDAAVLAPTLGGAPTPAGRSLPSHQRSADHADDSRGIMVGRAGRPDSARRRRPVATGPRCCGPVKCGRRPVRRTTKRP
jgi:hypothetical protein